MRKYFFYIALFLVGCINNGDDGFTDTWSGTPPDPWPNSTLTTVSENACGNCHQPHLAAGGPRLLNYAVEEDNCLACHNGNVAKHVAGESGNQDDDQGRYPGMLVS